jgi:hypothetical protein
MTPVLCAGHVPIHPESSIDSSDLPSAYALGHKRFHAVPQLIVERLVYDPVEIVREDARVFTLRPHWCVGDELHRLACCNN